MTGRPFIDAVDRVNLFDLKLYLERSGWRRLPSKDAPWVTYELAKEGAQGIELLLPTEEYFKDTRKRILDAVTVLSQLEDRDPIAVARDLQSVNADSLSFRLEIAEGSDAVPLADAARHIRAIRNLVQFGCCSELQAKKHFEVPLPAAEALLQNFQFCHTFRGSFGFEVTNTIVKQRQNADLFEAPVQRKVVARIARGIALLRIATDSEDPSVLIDSYESGLNARMCDSIAEIGLDGEISYQLGIEWAHAIPAPPDLVKASTIRITERETSVLRYAAEQLKIVPPERQTVVGQVVNLHCVTDPKEGGSRRTIELKISHPEFGTIDVRLALGPAAYQKAIDAHASGKHLSATGELQRKGNTWTLDAISEVAGGATEA